MHRLPQYHRGNPQVECQNIHQVNQYDTPLPVRVFIARHALSVLKFIKVVNPTITKTQRENSIHPKHTSSDQYDTPLSVWVFIARHTLSVPKSIKVFNPIITKSQRENLIHHNKTEREKQHMIKLY